jgi:uncharacterized protein with GYD domain
LIWGVSREPDNRHSNLSRDFQIGGTMQTFIALITYTDQGIRGIRDSPRRAEAAIAQAKEAGLTIKDVYWTSGAYDGLLVLEAPDEAAACAFFLSLAKAGNVRTQTLRAYGLSEFERILAKVE